ncbi:MAG: cob(I)yrinic acid a,c-diamide adenosyltransferase [Bacteroides sp.]|nr:cob(I)yrinic acid a,c-diamide adenosyltransferase [Bacteroides sp.]
MEKSKLYTRTGDTGSTSLVGGARIAKDSVRLEAYGTLDEFSSFLGCVLSDPKCNEEVKCQLLSVQNMLFNLGGYLASEVPEGEKPAAWGLTPEHISRLEGWIDALDEQTPKVNAFVLPGGCMLAAKTHVARTVCRRAERRIITLANTEYVDPALISYINRLSDYLFILARYFNFSEGVAEITWHKD